jgi:predicted exporter
MLVLSLWIACIAAAGAYTHRQLAGSSDQRLFFPTPATAEQRLLLEGLGEGPAARVLVVALDGARPEDLADASHAIVASLEGDDAFLFVANGALDLYGMPEALLPYRYLLSSTFDGRPLGAEILEEALTARARDLASPIGTFFEPLLARDPTLEVATVLGRWQPTQGPRREFAGGFWRHGSLAGMC